MRAVASTVYRLVCFPHQGKIVLIDWLYYCTPNVRFDTTANVPLVSNSHPVSELIGAVLFKDPCLMGVFPPPVPDAFVAPINMISSVGTFMGDPWILPNPTKVETYGDTMSLSPAEKIYFAIQSMTLSLQSLGSSAPWVVLSLTASSLLASPNHVPLPSSLNGETLSTSNHTYRRPKRKGGRHRKRKPHQKAPASGHHVGHHLPSSSTNHTGGRIPMSDHHNRKKWSYRAKSSLQAR